MPPVLARLTIQNTIKTELALVAGVENIYTDFPRANDIDEFVTKFMQSDEANLQFWLIRRTSSPISTDFGRIPTRSIWFMHQFEIELWYGIKTDDSEIKFQALIDSVLGVFAEKRTLGGCYVPIPLQLSRIRNDSKNQIQCRVGTFDITVQDQQNNLTPV